MAVTRGRNRTGKGSNKKTAYLTKRILISAASQGIRAAAAETMEIMGYVVIAMDGWVVKKYSDGRIERISKIEHQKRPKQITLV
jgi:hypothetical protein